MRVEKKLLVAAMSALLVSPMPVWAGELEDLKADMAKMMKRIEQLEAHKASAPTASSGKPTMATGNDKVRVSLSGQVNRAILFADDGDKTETHHVDNDASSTRFRIIGETDTTNGTTVGAAMEVQFESNSSASVSQSTGGGDASSDNFTQRRLEIYFDNADYGKVWLGQGWTASEGTSEVDLSGTGMAGYSDVDIVAGGILFRTSAGALTGPSVSAAFTNIDGLGRRDRIRYDTPSIAGFKLMVSHSQGDAVDAAVSYDAKYDDGTKVSAALAWADPDTSVKDQINGSVSLLLAGGLNFTLAAGEQDTPSGSDPSFIYAKVGYKSGNDAYSVDYQQSEDVAATGDEATAYGFQYARTIPEWATDAYLGVRQHELDRPGSSFQDVTAVIAGARVQF